MAIDKKSIKKIFPHLYEELETGEVKVPINAVRKNPVEAEEAATGDECEDCTEEEFVCTETPDKLRHLTHLPWILSADATPRRRQRRLLLICRRRAK